MKLKIEVTDTFGDRWSGNYSWVERKEIELSNSFWGKQASIIRRVKAAIGWSGMRADVYDYGDQYVISPRGACLVAFVDYLHS